MNGPLSDYRLEKLRLGELPAEEARELLRDPDTARRLALFEESDRRFLEKYPCRPELYAAAGKKKSLSRRLAETLRSILPRPLVLAPALGLCAVLTVGLFVLPRGQNLPEQDFRIKGGASSLYVFKKTSGEASELSNGSVVRPGDTLQVAYSTALPVYGYIFSLDGNGQVTSHFPDKGNSAAVLQNGKLKLLDHSYILDDAPNYEIFMLLTSREPFDLHKVKALASVLKSERDVSNAFEKQLGEDYDLVAVKLVKE